MCGIFCAFGTPGNFDMETLIKATTTMKHRGPDENQYWMSDDKKVGLGHTRLSIIDLDGGIQPLHNEDNSIHTIVNGEIYDFESIRDMLISEGHKFKTASDSEVLLHLYEEFGLDSVQQLRGEYAFVIWDSNTNRLIACRDRFGIKPLYYSYQNGTLYFASEIKALIAAGVESIWDEETLYISTHILGIPLQNRTYFKNIFQVPPGHYVIANDYQYRTIKYWDFNYPKKEMHSKINEKDAIKEFRNRFDEAVKLRLRADVPVGVYLSGGIDSCSILGTASKFSTSKIKAFNISFNDSLYDEASVAKEMAEYCNAEYVPLNINDDLLVDNFIDTIWHGETIMGNLHVVAKFLLSGHVRDSGYKVVLTGEGSDEILGGYPHFRKDMLFHSDEYKNNPNIQNLLNELAEKNQVSKNLLISKKDSYDKKNIFNRRLGFIPSWIELHMERRKNGSGNYYTELFDKFKKLDPYCMFLDEMDINNQLKGRHILNQSMYLWSKTMLPNYLLSNLGDRMEMAHSVEGRLPFLDHKLVEFVTTLPISMKINNLTEKYILRESVKPVLTETLYKRQKHPFLAPPSSTNVNNKMFLFLCEYIGDNISKVPFVDSKKILSIISKVPELTDEKLKVIDTFFVILASFIALQEKFKLVIK